MGILMGQPRTIGTTGIQISPIAMGCWPIAGITSLHVNDQDSLATLAAALEAGVNFFDTAYCYGTEGESERLLARALAGFREQVVIATKGGIHWDSNGVRCQDARPETLRRQCETSLQRLQTDRIELLYLHAPDPQVPLEESAGALAELLQQGKTRAVGVSNCSVDQLERFQSVCPIAAVQPPYNMLQRQIEVDLLPWCRQRGISVMVYWPLMKGLLAGQLARDHVFEPQDGRAKYPMFQGREWQKNQDFLDRLRPIAEAGGHTVAQLVVNWTIHQPGITAAICGAKRAYQIRETAGALGWQLTKDQIAAITAALEDRGAPITRGAV